MCFGLQTDTNKSQVGPDTLLFLRGQNWRKVARILQDMREHTVEADVITYSSDACWRFRYLFNAFNRDCFESLCNLSGFFGDITFQFG